MTFRPLIALLFTASLAFGQDRLALTPTSTYPSAVLAVAINKECSGVVVTKDVASAEYSLEAEMGFFDGDEELVGLTLYAKNGDILFQQGRRNGLVVRRAIKRMCKSIGRAK